MTVLLDPVLTTVDPTPLVEAGPDLALGDVQLSDDELDELALAANPLLVTDFGGAVPWTPTGAGLLPDWYMAPGMPRPRRGWRRVVALAIVVGLVAINAAGLCITYGHLVIA